MEMFLASNLLVSVRKKEDLKEQQKPCEKCKAFIKCGDIYILCEKPSSYDYRFTNRTYYHWSCYLKEHNELCETVALTLGVSVNDLSKM